MVGSVDKRFEAFQAALTSWVAGDPESNCRCACLVLLRHMCGTHVGCRRAVAVTCGYAVVEEIDGVRIVGADSSGDRNVSAQAL